MEQIATRDHGVCGPGETCPILGIRSSDSDRVPPIRDFVYNLQKKRPQGSEHGSFARDNF